MKRRLSVLILMLLVIAALPGKAQAEPIRWVDFGISYEALR